MEAHNNSLENFDERGQAAFAKGNNVRQEAAASALRAPPNVNKQKGKNNMNHPNKITTKPSTHQNNQLKPLHVAKLTMEYVALDCQVGPPNPLAHGPL